MTKTRRYNLERALCDIWIQKKYIDNLDTQLS